MTSSNTKNTVASNARHQELEEAAVWVTGDGDALAKSGHPLGGVVAAIVDIMIPMKRSPADTAAPIIMPIGRSL